MDLIFYYYASDPFTKHPTVVGLKFDQRKKVIGGILHSLTSKKWVKLKAIPDWQNVFDGDQSLSHKGRTLFTLVPNQEDYNSEEKLKEIFSDLL